MAVSTAAREKGAGSVRRRQRQKDIFFIGGGSGVVYYLEFRNSENQKFGTERGGRARYP
jgi:hypothetical protein